MVSIILHAGTPKTGTTSLQLYLDRNRDALLDSGVLYPRAGLSPQPEPKHQWMIGQLMRGEMTAFQAMVEQALAEVRADTQTVILSSEGLFHRWWDFPEAGLAALSWLAARYPVQLWVFFREPVSFARSFYIQMLKNPRGLGPCYGQDLAITEMLRDPRFALHFDYIGYIRQVERWLGAGSVRPFRYAGDTVADALAALGLSGLPPPETRENRTVGSLGVSILRKINQRNPTQLAKAEAVRLVEALDRLVDDYGSPFLLSPADIELIGALSRPSLAALMQEYGLEIGLASEVAA